MGRFTEIPADRPRPWSHAEDGPEWWRGAAIPERRDVARDEARRAGWLPRFDLFRIGWEYWEEPNGTLRFLTLNGFWGKWSGPAEPDVAEGEHG